MKVQIDTEIFPTEKPPDPQSESPGAVATATGADIQGVREKGIEGYRKPNVNVQSAAALSTERSVPSHGGRHSRHLLVCPLFEFGLISDRVHDAIAALRRDADAKTSDPHQTTVEAEAPTPTSNMITPPVAVGASAERGVMP